MLYLSYFDHRCLLDGKWNLNLLTSFLEDKSFIRYYRIDFIITIIIYTSSNLILTVDFQVPRS